MAKITFFSIFIILIYFDFTNSTTNSHGHGSYPQLKMFPWFTLEGLKSWPNIATYK